MLRSSILFLLLPCFGYSQIVREKRIYNGTSTVKEAFNEQYSKTGKIVQRLLAEPYCFEELKEESHHIFRNVKEVFYYDANDSLSKQLIIQIKGYNATTFLPIPDSIMFFYSYYYDTLNGIKETTTACAKCANDTVIDRITWSDSSGIKIKVSERRAHQTTYTEFYDGKAYKDSVIKEWQKPVVVSEERYDSMNRLLRKVYSTGQAEVYQYDAKGRLAGILHNSGRIRFKYEKRRITAFHFDKVSNIPGLIVTKEFDSKNRLISRAQLYQPGGIKYSKDLLLIHYDKKGKERQVEKESYNYEQQEKSVLVQTYRYSYAE